MIRLTDLHINLPGFSVSGINLHIAPGEFFSLIGPTGAGKTLILECIAGLIKPSRGSILIGGRDITRLPPEKRRVGIVYQDHALFPHLSVKQNIAYGLRYSQGQTGAEPEKELRRLIDRLGISHLMDRRVHRLSGGEKQRIALARALAVKPEVLLLDEPLSALDPNFRTDIRNMLANLHRSSGLTCLMVTHDFNDVLTLADHMAVLNQGRLEQVGKVDRVFNSPASCFVAGFVGTKNVFAADFTGSLARVGGLELHLDGPAPQGAGHICIRAEGVVLAPAGGNPDNGKNPLRGRIKALTDLGSHWEVQLDVSGLTLYATVSAQQARELGVGGEHCQALLDPSYIHCMV